MNEEKQVIIERFMNGESLFITGKAGTGKSYLVNEMIKRKPKSILLGTTGIAATNIRGITINSFFRFFKRFVIDESISSWDSEYTEFVKKVETIFIDEISMLRADTLDKIEDIMLFNTGKSLSDIQLIFVGDMKQLPPVVTKEDRDVLKTIYPKGTGYFWYESLFSQSKLKGNMKTCELKQIFRQTDEKFIDYLNLLRDEIEASYNFKYTKEVKGVLLTSTNKKAGDINKEELAKIDSKEWIFDAEVHYNYNDNDFIFEKELHLKDGCKIMYLENSCGLYNGSLGTCIIRNGIPFFKNKEREVQLVKIRRDKIRLGNNGEEIVESFIIQYPIKLAYAITIHKSQGLSLDELTIDNKNMFLPAMKYVAFSRCKYPEHLYILRQ